MSDRQWFLRTQDETFGPETRETLVEWAQRGRIQPGHEVSDDNVIWTKVEEVPFLDMRFSIDIGDGNPRGPFNKVAADALIASGRLPPSATVVEVRAPFESESEVVEEPSSVDFVEESTLATAGEETASAPAGEDTLPASAVGEPDVVMVEEEVSGADVSSIAVAEASDEDASEVAKEPEQLRFESIEATIEPTPKVVEPEVRVVERVVEVPVEKIVEKEVRVEVPVEKIVEKIVTVVDNTRVQELEGMLGEERSRVAVLQGKLDESSKTASEQRNEVARLEGELKNADERVKLLEAELSDSSAKFEKSAKDAVDRESKLREQVAALEDELRRLPQAASEVADIQASMYGLMTREAQEIESIIAAEKAEFEEFRKRCQDRSDRLLERRREILKRVGNNIEEMTRKSLIERPEDPRTAQLRRDLEELRRIDEKKTLDAMTRIRDLESQLKDREAESKRISEGMEDVTELRRQNTELREKLQQRERELLAERERAEAFRVREAANHQAMVARLKVLESPSIGTTSSVSTNQSREAKQVKLPGWMRIGGK